jgi:Uma2 family endonuclease
MSGQVHEDSILGRGVTITGVSPPILPALDAPPIPAVTIIPRDDSDELVIPLSARTHDGFRQWALSDDYPERGKITFVEGEIIVDMSPESIEEHSAIKTEVCRVLANLVRSKQLGQLHIDGVLISHKSARVSNEPDALFISKSTLQSKSLTFTAEKGRPQSSKEIVGAVDFVLEIVSPSSRRKDQRLLRSAYFNAGIPEYWIIDALVDDNEEVKFDVLVAGKSGYESVRPVDGWLASPTFQCSFRLTRERDEDGFWAYTLSMKATVEGAS